MKFGHLEKGSLLFVTGFIPFILLVIVNNLVRFSDGTTIPYWYTLLIMMGCFLMFMGLFWIIANVKKSQADVPLDHTAPEEVKVFRVTRDGIILLSFAPKGATGKIETLAYGENVDFYDDGSFPLRTLDGSPAVLIFDMLNTVIDLKRTIGRKFMKKHGADGVDLYKKWQNGKKGLSNGKEEK